MANVSEKLKEKLDACALTVYALAKQSGLPQSTIKNVFYGRSEKPSLDLLQKLSYYLHCSVEDLLSDEDPRRNKIIGVGIKTEFVPNKISFSLDYNSQKIASVFNHVFDVALFWSKKAGDAILENGVKELFKINLNILKDKQDYPYRVMSWSFLDWINNDDIMVASSTQELTSPENVKKFREYYVYTKSNPRSLIFDPPSIGLPSGEFIIPAAVGFNDEEDKYFGAISMGFNIERFKSEIKNVIGNENISYLVLDQKNNIVFGHKNIEENNLNHFCKRFENIDFNGKGILKNKIDFNGSIYSNYISLKNYPFYILVGLEW